MRCAKFSLIFCLWLPLSALAGSEPFALTGQDLVIENRTVSAQIPEGYTLELLTTRLRGPRMLTFHDDGTLFIGSNSGDVYRLSPPYTEPQTLVQLDDYPHSIAFHDDRILIAQETGLYAAPFTAGQDRLEGDSLKKMADIPGGHGHSSRTVKLGPDGRIYLSLGISGNCSDEYIDHGYPFDDRRGGIMVLEDGQWQVFATGLRNPVGFDWHPQTGVAYASNNGPDHWGYEQPPEVFVRLEPGSFHGMPWFQYDGRSIQRDDCIAGQPPRSDVTLPAATFPARNAPMAVAFVPASAMDRRFSGDAVVALHGSWGTQPDGGASGHPATRRPPKLVIVRFDAGKAVRVDDLVAGFQNEHGQRWARPVGVAIGPDGALYFSSDGGFNGLFRLRHK